MFIGLRLFEIAVFLYLSLFWINYTPRHHYNNANHATITTTPTTPPLQQRQPRHHYNNANHATTTTTTKPRHHYNNHQTTPPQQPPRSDSAHVCQKPGLRRGKAGGPRSPPPLNEWRRRGGFHPAREEEECHGGASVADWAEDPSFWKFPACSGRRGGS